jgi:hypothetical protein
MHSSLKFFVSQNFRAYEYFERMGLARRIFRRCIELSDSLSVQGEKVGAGREKAAQIRRGESPARCEKLLPCRLADRSRRFTVRKEHSHGLPVRTPIAVFGCVLKVLFFQWNYGRAGRHARCRPHTAAAPIACFLRNTFPKTAPGACDWGCSSLHVGTHWLMWRCDGGGNPKSSQPEDRG